MMKFTTFAIRTSGVTKLTAIDEDIAIVIER